MGGWLENEFLKKTPSQKFGLESQLGTSDLEFVKNQHWDIGNVIGTLRMKITKLASSVAKQ